MKRTALLLWTLCLIPAGAGPGWPGEVDILNVQASPLPNGTWRFDVTVRHDDEGWEHYADSWEVVDPNGRLITRRVLRHPHVGQASFTRSQVGFSIPDHLEWVTVRGHDKIHGYGGAEKKVELSRPPTKNKSIGKTQDGP